MVIKIAQQWENHDEVPLIRRIVWLLYISNCWLLLMGESHGQSCSLSLSCASSVRLQHHHVSVVTGDDSNSQGRAQYIQQAPKGDNTGVTHAFSPVPNHLRSISERETYTRLVGQGSLPHRPPSSLSTTSVRLKETSSLSIFKLVKKSQRKKLNGIFILSLPKWLLNKRDTGS